MGNHPFYKEGNGPAGFDWVVSVACHYNADNYAVAYGPLNAWRDENRTKLWLFCAELDTDQHIVYAGDSPESLQEVYSIPGLGGRNVQRDEIISIPGNYSFIKLVEEPDGSETRVIEVMEGPPAQVAGWDHRIPEVETSESCRIAGQPRWNYPGECPDWVIWGPQHLLNAAMNWESFPERWSIESILADMGYTGGVEWVVAPSTSGWDLHEYLYFGQQAWGKCPNVLIIGSGCDVEEYEQNWVSPHKQPDCPGCFTEWQSGDVAWGVVEDEY